MLKSQVLPLRDDPRIQMMRRSSSVKPRRAHYPGSQAAIADAGTQRRKAKLALGLLLFALALEPSVTAPSRSQLGR